MSKAVGDACLLSLALIAQPLATEHRDHDVQQHARELVLSARACSIIVEASLSFLPRQPPMVVRGVAQRLKPGRVRFCVLLSAGPKDAT